MSGVGLIDCQVTLKEIRTKMGNLNQQELNQFILGIIGRLERTTEGKSETCLGHVVAFFGSHSPPSPMSKKAVAENFLKQWKVRIPR